MVSAFMFDESMEIKSLFLYVCVSSHYIRIYKSYNQELSIDIQSIKQHVNVQFWVVDTDSILSTQSMFNCFKCFSTSGIIENVRLYLHASGCSRFVPLVFNAAFKMFRVFEQSFFFVYYPPCCCFLGLRQLTSGCSYSESSLCWISAGGFSFLLTAESPEKQSLRFKIKV